MTSAKTVFHVSTVTVKVPGPGQVTAFGDTTHSTAGTEHSACDSRVCFAEHSGGVRDSWQQRVPVGLLPLTVQSSVESSVWGSFPGSSGWTLSLG